MVDDRHEGLKAANMRAKMNRPKRSKFDERNQDLLSKAEASHLQKRRFERLPRDQWTPDMWKEYNDAMGRRSR